jgi:triacylglycerol lipase
VLQLTPEGIDLFYAAVPDRAGVDCGCVVEAVPPPRIARSAQTLLDPEYLTLRALFRLLHGLTSRPHPRYPYPKTASATKRRLDQALGFKVTPATNDGIVPKLSQLRGRVLLVARADHLDVVGHYTLAVRSAAGLPSDAGFTPQALEANWDAVAAAICGERGRDR